MEHCDFIPLRNMLVRTHLQDLKDVTNNVHYENYRCRKLAGVAGGSVDKIPNRVSCSSCVVFKLITRMRVATCESLRVLSPVRPSVRLI